jgi:hypothetical protein
MKTKAIDELTGEQTKKARTEEETPKLPSFTDLLNQVNQSPVFQRYESDRIRKKLVQLVRELDDDLQRTLSDLTQLRAEDEQKQARLNEAQEKIRGLELENEALIVQNDQLREKNKTLLRCNETLYQQTLSFFKNDSSGDKTTNPELEDFNEACTVSLSD